MCDYGSPLLPPTISTFHAILVRKLQCGFLYGRLSVGKIREYSVGYYQSHGTLLWIWIMVCSWCMDELSKLYSFVDLVLIRSRLHEGNLIAHVSVSLCSCYNITLALCQTWTWGREYLERGAASSSQDAPPSPHIWCWRKRNGVHM